MKDRFAFKNYDENRHFVILFDEFTMASFEAEELKALLAREHVTVHSKHKPNRTIRHISVNIIISNHADIKQDALLDPMQLIEANVFIKPEIPRVYWKARTKLSLVKLP